VDRALSAAGAAVLMKDHDERGGGKWDSESLRGEGHGGGEWERIDQKLLPRLRRKRATGGRHGTKSGCRVTPCQFNRKYVLAP